MNSKNKGNTFERKIAKILSERFEQVTGLKSSFRRATDSGAYFGGKNQSRMAEYDLDKAEFGDIVTPKNFVFSVECKHYKTPPSFSQISNQDCKMLDGWIEKAVQDAGNSKRNMLVIMKFNNVKETVIIDKLFGNLTSFITYKGYHIVTLDDFLSQGDQYFFK